VKRIQFYGREPLRGRGSSDILGPVTLPFLGYAAAEPPPWLCDGHLNT
jgi:hypothetical protein